MVAENAKNARIGRRFLTLWELKDDELWCPVVELLEKTRGKMRFLVDTGSSMSYVFADKPKVRWEEIEDVFGGVRCERVGEEFDFGFFQIRFYKLEDSIFKVLKKEGISGIIGVNFLYDKVINLYEKRLYL